LATNRTSPFDKLGACAPGQKPLLAFQRPLMYSEVSMMAKVSSKKKNNQVVQFIKANPDLFTFPKIGDVVSGKILEKGSRAIIVDLGKYGTGAIYRGELLNARDAVRDVEVGQEIQAKIMEVDNDEGLIELSLSEAEKQKNWVEIKELYEKEEIIRVKMRDANKGGLMADVVGIKAFLPASQLSPEHYPSVEGNDKNKIEDELKKLIGETLEIKIIDVNSRANKLIISERAALEISARELAKNYEVGQVVDGIISGMADFGAFMKFTDNQQVEGLIHVSELEHRLIENPKEVLKIDDPVKAKIIDIKDGKISLSLKALKKDPWEETEKRFKEGQEIEGTVYSFNPFGATIDLGEGIQGQVHVTDFGGIAEMKKTLKESNKYKFRVKEVKPEEKRINLSYI